MDPVTRQIIRLLVPQVPTLVRVALMHTLSLSAPSKYRTLKSELIITVLRSLFRPPTPTSITSSQALSIIDPGVKGKLWVANTSSPPVSASDAAELLASVRSAIDALLEPGAPKLEEPHFYMPEVIPIEAEWTGYRPSASSGSLLPEVGEGSRYELLMKDTTTPTTILYFHGGAYYMLDPASHRHVTSRLAKMTGGRVYSVRYRLAPQNPFPAALVDALVSYLTLLYPSQGSFHNPVNPAHIVFSGDSAGGNLSLALLQFILQLGRQQKSSSSPSSSPLAARKEGPMIRWQGRDVALPLPGGVAVNSPWLDLTLSSPSWNDPEVHAFDFIPSGTYMLSNKPPPCEAWPTDLPRESYYVADTALAHPLVSLVMARNWRGAPPVYICTGWEILSPEDRWLANKLRADGVTVVLEEYEAMPHCFALALGGTKEGRRCFKGWSGFMSTATNTPMDRVINSSSVGADDAEETQSLADTWQASVQSRLITIKAKTTAEVEIPPEELTNITDEEMHERVWRQMKDIIPWVFPIEKAAKL